jgi:hypothetical protein
MGFLSIPKPTYFQHVRCDARKERRSTRCSLSSTNTNDGSNKSGGDDIEVTETEGETNDNRMPYFFLYYTISMDGRQSRIMKAKVHKGDDIDSIIDEIKMKNSILLASVDPTQLEIFASFEQEEPLNVLEEWYPNATWGTKQQPLIVKANPLIASVATTSPWKRSFGKCDFVQSGVLLLIIYALFANTELLYILFTNTRQPSTIRFRKKVPQIDNE